MSNKWGIHLPNGPLTNDLVWRLGVSHFTLLHLQANDFALQARKVSPQGIILVRFYLSQWSQHDPRAWARECTAEYTKERWYDGQPFTLAGLGCHATPGNEMNLPDEGGGWTQEWYERINWWLLEWRDEFIALTGCPVERLHFPAFAYGHSDDQNDLGYIGLEICRPAVEAYGVLDVHPYWFQPEQVLNASYGHRFELAHALFPDKPIFCSETGNFDVARASTAQEMAQWFESLYDYPYVLGGTPFIWEDPTGAHGVNDWSRNPQLGEFIAVFPKQEIGGPTPEPEPQEDNMEFQYAFKDLYDKAPKTIGEPVATQIDVVPGRLSFQMSENGLLVYQDGIAKFLKQSYPRKKA